MRAPLKIRSTVFLLSILAIVSLSSVRVFAQDQKAPATASQPKGDFMSPQTASSQNMAAAEQEDETAVYKQSPSVRAVGKMLGLSPRASSALFEYLNFAILAGVILFYLIKLLPKTFRDRQTKIDSQLVEARTATDQANQRLKAVEERLGRLDHEIDELRKRSEHEAAADEQRIKQSIEEERKRIVAATEQEIASATAVAERSLRKFAAELAIDRAMGRLQLTDQQDRALVHDFASGRETEDLRERRN